jgi:hypothetical protein
MPRFRVYVQAEGYRNGSVLVEADTLEEAENYAHDGANDEDIDWDPWIDRQEALEVVEIHELGEN